MSTRARSPRPKPRLTRGSRNTSIGRPTPSTRTNSSNLHSTFSAPSGRSTIACATKRTLVVSCRFLVTRSSWVRMMSRLPLSSCSMPCPRCRSARMRLLVFTRSRQRRLQKPSLSRRRQPLSSPSRR
ncbi:hypothetical protein BN1708_005383 [Verticillium longisporum]|uniref:Uncharacterized protein n=1 Tax=Verticillium longisporum TaxID=100787 RepID=A0A0G4MA75_VERLO|nr:hypothetical protein BN1708_005383 [Verticillium longisporum]